MSALIKILYSLRDSTTESSDVSVRMSLLLYNHRGGQGVAHTFCDEVCHMNGCHLPCSLKGYEVNFFQFYHVS